MNGLSGAAYKAMGAGFLAILLAFTFFCVGMYNNLFTASATVVLEIERAGLVLLQGSDVKVRGINVGTVQDITSDGQGARITMELSPDELVGIPADVQARLVPKTLFGEKYVDLVIPADPVAERLADGDVIPEDRSEPTLELNEVLDNVLPLLRTLRPQDLSYTLNALATALDGRGDTLGQTLVDVDAYLTGLNPLLPQLRRDLTALADVTEVYDAAAPDLLDTVRNLLTTADTVVSQQEQLGVFLREVTGAADATRRLLEATGDDVVRVNAVNRRVVSLLEEFSPVFTCFWAGYAIVEEQIFSATGQVPGAENYAHIVATFTPPAPEYQWPQNLPEYTDTSGPDCWGLPDPDVHPPKVQFSDGTEDDPRFSSRASETTVRPSAMRGGLSRQVDPVDALLAPAMGVPAEEVPAIGGLLWTPVVAGAEVVLG